MNYIIPNQNDPRQAQGVAITSVNQMEKVMEWRSIESAPENVVVRTKISDGNGTRNEALLKRQGRLWWFPDGSMYVYYTPTHWTAATPDGARDE